MRNVKIAIFSEGKNYLSTFKPIIDAFIEYKIDFKYYSFDKNDPIFSIYNENIKYRYLGKGFFGYLKFSFLEADYLISTTPNIGTRGFPLKKPKKVKSLLHVFHSISDIAIYKKGSLDYYDSVFLVGSFQIQSIRYLEEKRKTQTKELISIGAPYLDYFLEHRIENNSDGNTVLIASSWGSKGCLKTYGVKYIIDLINNGFNIIIRPHPQSYISESKYIAYCKNELSTYSNIEWDETSSPLMSMSKSDILISDTSSIRFDYYYLYKKPIITLEIDQHNMKGYEQEDLKSKNNLFNDFFGVTVNMRNISKISNIINSSIKNKSENKLLKKLNELNIPKIGSSSKKIAAYFNQIIAENENKF